MAVAVVHQREEETALVVVAESVRILKRMSTVRSHPLPHAVVLVPDPVLVPALDRLPTRHRIAPLIAMTILQLTGTETARTGAG